MSGLQHNRLGVSDMKPADGDLLVGELVPNEADGTLWSKNQAGSVYKIGVAIVDANTDGSLDGLSSNQGFILDRDKAPLASPALTGIPTVPDASSNTNSTQVANTKFVQVGLAAIDATSLSRLDNIISRQDITAMTYTGGTGGDLLDSITYANDYSEVYTYDGSDNLQYIDHKVSTVNTAYTTMTFSGSNLTSVVFTDGARV